MTEINHFKKSAKYSKYILAPVEVLQGESERSAMNVQESKENTSSQSRNSRKEKSTSRMFTEEDGWKKHHRFIWEMIFNEKLKYSNTPILVR